MPNFNLGSAQKCTDEAAAVIHDIFDYHDWDEDQKLKGSIVREALMYAVRVIIDNVPPSADRSTAIRKIREARMDANSAITHAGKY